MISINIMVLNLPNIRMGGNPFFTMAKFIEIVNQPVTCVLSQKEFDIERYWVRCNYEHQQNLF